MSPDADFPSTYHRLEQWGRWCTNEIRPMWYPSMSPEQMAAEGTGINTRGSGFVGIDMPAEVEETEQALLSVRRSDLKAYRALWYYFNLNMTLRQMGKTIEFRTYYSARKGLYEAVKLVDEKL